jgi:hypothetical protein
MNHDPSRKPGRAVNWTDDADPASRDLLPLERTHRTGWLVRTVAVVGAVAVAAGLAALVVNVAPVAPPDAVSTPAPPAGAEKPEARVAPPPAAPPQPAVTGGLPSLAAAPPAATVPTEPPPPAPAAPPAAPAAAPPAAEVAALPAPTAPPAAPEPGRLQMSGEEIVAHLQKGEERLAAGDVAVARLYFERVAESGDPRGATGMARTYDAEVLARLPVIGLTPDPDAARRWSERAKTLEAAIR